MFDDIAVKRPRGRPSVFTNELAAEICASIERGHSLRRACQADSMPSARTVHRWLHENEDFRQQYARSRAIQTEVFIDQIVDLADAVANETEPAKVQAAKLAIDTRKWVAARMLPKKYGDRVDIQQDGQLVVRIVLGLGELGPSMLGPGGERS